MANRVKPCQFKNRDGTCQEAADQGHPGLSCKDTQANGACTRMNTQKRMLYRARSAEFKQGLLDSGWRKYEVEALTEMVERGYKVLQLKKKLWGIKNDVNDIIVGLLEDE